MSLAQFVIQYGQAVAWALIVIAFTLVVRTARRGGHWRPLTLGSAFAYLLALGFTFVAVSFLGWSRHKVDPLKPVFRAAGTAAPELTFTTLEDGAVHRLSDYRGHVVVLNLWATWCPPCRAEMPDLDQLQRRHQADGVVVLTLSDESAAAVNRFPGLAGMQFVKGLVDTSAVHSLLLVRAKVARPVTHLIDRDGVLRETLLDRQPLATFEEKLARLL